MSQSLGHSQCRSRATPTYTTALRLLPATQRCSRRYRVVRVHTLRPLTSSSPHSCTPSSPHHCTPSSPHHCTSICTHPFTLAPLIHHPCTPSSPHPCSPHLLTTSPLHPSFPHTSTSSSPYFCTPSLPPLATFHFLISRSCTLHPFTCAPLLSNSCGCRRGSPICPPCWSWNCHGSSTTRRVARLRKSMMLSPLTDSCSWTGVHMCVCVCVCVCV